MGIFDDLSKHFFQGTQAGLKLIGGSLYNNIPIDGGQGSSTDARLAREQANEQQLRGENFQREFAKSGVQWRVEDAIKAGIHPLAAMGMQGPSASPIMVGDTGPTQQSFSVKDGVDVGRSIMATMSPDDRQIQKLNLMSMQLDIEGKSLQNQLLGSQIRKLNQVGPPLPSAVDQPGGMSGQGNFKVKPSESTSSSRAKPAQQAGAINDYGFARTSSGGYIPIPSVDIKERIEDNLFHETGHFFRNNLLPNFTGGSPPDPKEYPLPKGFDYWGWDQRYQQYMPKKKGRSNYYPFGGY